MKLNSAQLEAFFTVAQFLNFTKAAKQLHVTQSALSQRIAKLEEELGTTLFIRDRASIRVTEAGQNVLRFCQLHNAAESELLSKLQNSEKDFAGVLRLAGFSSVNRSLVIPALKKLMAKNPRLSLQLLTKEIPELSSLLQSAEADYIFTNKKNDSADIESIFLGFEDSVMVKTKKAADSSIFLDHDENDPTTKSYFSQNKLAFKPLTIRYLDDIYGLIDGVKQGYGKAILPLHLIENDASFEILEPQRILRVAVYLQFFVQPYYRKVHAAFVEDIRHYFSEHLKQAK